MAQLRNICLTLFSIVVLPVHASSLTTGSYKETEDSDCGIGLVLASSGADYTYTLTQSGNNTSGTAKLNADEGVLSFSGMAPGAKVWVDEESVIFENYEGSASSKALFPDCSAQYVYLNHAG